jgi:hypothetical protein
VTLIAGAPPPTLPLMTRCSTLLKSSLRSLRQQRLKFQNNF